MPLTVYVVTQDRNVLERNDAQRLIVSTSEGQITILPGHAPLMASLSGGRRTAGGSAEPSPTSEMIAITPGEEIVLAVHGGFIQVANDHVTVLADSAEQAEEIDLERAEAARERAERILSDSTPTGTEEMDLLRAKLALQRALLRLNVGRRSTISSSAR